MIYTPAAHKAAGVSFYGKHNVEWILPLAVDF